MAMCRARMTAVVWALLWGGLALKMLLVASGEVKKVVDEGVLSLAEIDAATCFSSLTAALLGHANNADMPLLHHCASNHLAAGRQAPSGLENAVKDAEDLKRWQRVFTKRVGNRLDRPQGASAGEEEECKWWSLCATEFTASLPVSRRAIVDSVNENRDAGVALWTAEMSRPFGEMGVEDMKKLMGTFVGDSAITLPAKRSEAQEGVLDKVAEVPESFDAREAFPFCKDIIGHVRDQSNCGSCWAFASTEAFNDRLCIASKGAFNYLLSPQHTTSCCGFFKCLSLGCGGGHPGMAWRWFRKEGVVTGGDFDDIGSGSTCWPYELPACSHHVDSPLPACASGKMYETPSCRAACKEQKYNTSEFEKDRHYAKEVYSLHSVDDIKEDIMKHGPVSAAFIVFEDFVSYKSGVYHHVEGNPLGGHAVKIIGWGIEEGTPYWLVVNCWNVYWGDKGLFKIKIGEAGINRAVLGGTAEWNAPDGATLRPSKLANEGYRMLQ